MVNLIVFVIKNIQVSAYVAQRSTDWIALGLGLLLGAGLTYAGLMLIAVSLLTTQARNWAIAGLASRQGKRRWLASLYLSTRTVRQPDYRFL
ncbi:MAG: hypothetical protein R6W76_22840 [Caldilinea sp.]